jgi:hypothetical protein
MKKATKSKLDAIFERVMKNPKRFVYKETQFDFSISDLYHNDCYANEIYSQYFKTKPNTIRFARISTDAFLNFISVNYQYDVSQPFHGVNTYDESGEGFTFFLLWGSVLVDIAKVRYPNTNIDLYFTHNDYHNVVVFSKALAKFLVESNKNTSIKNTRIYQYVDRNNIERKIFERRKHFLNLEDNYNESLSEFHQKLVTILHTRKNGLVVLEGESGSGKSYYLRHLMCCLKKEFVIIPIENLTEFLYQNSILNLRNSIIVIDQFDDILTENSCQVNTFLRSLTDGILTEYFNFPVIVICQNIEKIDPILLGNGRLIARYYFNKLNKYKTNSLLRKLLKGNTANGKPMLLGDIYKKAADSIGPNFYIEKANAINEHLPDWIKNNYIIQVSNSIIS